MKQPVLIVLRGLCITFNNMLFQASIWMQCQLFSLFSLLYIQSCVITVAHLLIYFSCT